MLRDPFAAGVSPARVHLSLRTLAANDNVPFAATVPPRRADGGASTRWPLLNRIGEIASASLRAVVGEQDVDDCCAPGLQAAGRN